MKLLLKLAEEAQVAEKIEALFRGEHLNSTEDRAVRCCAASRQPLEQHLCLAALAHSHRPGFARRAAQREDGHVL